MKVGWIGVAAMLVAACGGADAGALVEGSGGTAGAAGSGGASGSGGVGGGSGGSGGAGGVGGGPVGGPIPSPGCGLGALSGGDSTVQVPGPRSYVLHVPAGYDGAQPVPLVLNFHGFTSNAGQQIIFSGMNETSDARGFVLAYPEGIGTSWNGGACCGQAATAGLDDVEFARVVVNDVANRACVDMRRVYATGMSNGGFMSHRLACEASDVFAAIGPVAGVVGIPFEQCNPGRPVPVIHFHGTNDALVPYGGGQLGFPGLTAGNFPSVPDTFGLWGGKNQCKRGPEVTNQVGAATCETLSDCAGGVRVTLCTIQGMNHCWPGKAFCPLLPSNTDLNANDAMLDFFMQFELP